MYQTSYPGYRQWTQPSSHRSNYSSDSGPSSPCNSLYNHSFDAQSNWELAEEQFVSLQASNYKEADDVYRLTQRTHHALRGTVINMSSITDHLTLLCQQYGMPYVVLCASNELCNRLLNTLIERHLPSIVPKHPNQPIFTHITSQETVNTTHFLCEAFFRFDVGCGKLTNKLRWLSSGDFVLIGCRVLAFVVFYLAYKLHGTSRRFSIRQMLRQGPPMPECVIIETHYASIEATVLKLLNFDLNIVALDAFVDILAVHLRQYLQKRHTTFAEDLDYVLDRDSLIDMFGYFYTHKINVLKATIEYHNRRVYNVKKEGHTLECLASDRMFLACGLLLATLLVRGCNGLAKLALEYLVVLTSEPNDHRLVALATTLTRFKLGHFL